MQYIAEAKSWTRLLGRCIMLLVPVELGRSRRPASRVLFLSDSSTVAGDDDDPQVRPHLRRNTAPPAGSFLRHRILTLVGFPAWVGGWQVGRWRHRRSWRKDDERHTRYGPKARRHFLFWAAWAGNCFPGFLLCHHDGLGGMLLWADWAIVGFASRPFSN
jgi:hypothetical protein